jgi:1-acyl-sn-glycerol-3-phosphate acyltransferase
MRLRHLIESLVLYAALALFALICLAWSAVALPMLLILPAGAGRRAGRIGILAGFRLFVWSLGWLGIYRLDLRALRGLRHGPPVVLAPNHPSLIDAVLIIAHEPRVACVMKSSLMNNIFLGPGARLARYIRSSPPRPMIRESVAELARGGIVLLFPEGTRTRSHPLNELQGSVAVIAKQAGVPIQTLIIETDSAFLSKGWSLFRRPSMPVTYRMRLGPCLDPPGDVRACMRQLDECLRAELAHGKENHRLEARGEGVCSS